MAIYHFSAQIIGRKAGKSAVASAAYRSGEVLTDTRENRTFEFGRTQRVAHAEIIAPGDAPAWARDRSDLWNEVERREKRKDSQLAREFEIALPRELDLAQQVELVRGWISAELTPAGAVADFAIHHDRQNQNPHVHIMSTMRAVTAEGWSPQKLRQWEDRSALEGWRASWAEHTNRSLERLGHEARVDHRSYAEQDAHLEPELRRKPTWKIGPWAIDGDRARANIEIIKANLERIRRAGQRILAGFSGEKPPVQVPAVAPRDEADFEAFKIQLAAQQQKDLEELLAERAAKQRPSPPAEPPRVAPAPARPASQPRQLRLDPVQPAAAPRDPAQEKVIDIFLIVARNRQTKARDYGDNGAAWLGLPKRSRDLVDVYNTASPATRDRMLDQIRSSPTMFQNLSADLDEQLRAIAWAQHSRGRSR